MDEPACSRRGVARGSDRWESTRDDGEGIDRGPPRLRAGQAAEVVCPKEQGEEDQRTEGRTTCEAAPGTLLGRQVRHSRPQVPLVPFERLVRPCSTVCVGHSREGVWPCRCWPGMEHVARTRRAVGCLQAARWGCRSAAPRSSVKSSSSVVRRPTRCCRPGSSFGTHHGRCEQVRLQRRFHVAEVAADVAVPLMRPRAPDHRRYPLRMTAA